MKQAIGFRRFTFRGVTKARGRVRLRLRRLQSPAVEGVRRRDGV